MGSIDSMKMKIIKVFFYKNRVVFGDKNKPTELLLNHDQNLCEIYQISVQIKFAADTTDKYGGLV